MNILLLKLKYLVLTWLLYSFCSVSSGEEFKEGLFSTGLANSTGEIRVDSKLNISIVVNRPFKDEFCRFYGNCTLKEKSLECIAQNYKKFPLTIDIQDPDLLEINSKQKNNQIVNNISCEQGVSLLGKYRRDKSNAKYTEVAKSGIIYSNTSDNLISENSRDAAEESNNSKRIKTDAIHKEELSSNNPSQKTSRSNIGELLKSCRKGNDLDCDTVGAILEESLNR